MSEPCERDFGSVKDSLIQRTMSDGVTSLKAPASHSRDEKATRSNQALPGKLLLIACTIVWPARPIPPLLFYYAEVYGRGGRV